MRNSYTYWAAGVAIIILGTMAGRHFLSSTAYHQLRQVTSLTAAPDPHEKRLDLLRKQRSIRTANDQSKSRDTARALTDGSAIDSSVIGRPFALSASMQSELNKDDVFRPARERLEQMAREPRDDEWAKLEESKIQDLFMSEEMYISNIECRTTICAVELVPVSEPFDVITIDQQLRRLDLSGPEYLTFANDFDDDGNRIKVAFFSTLRR
jgi:hypothetical protein